MAQAQPEELLAEVRPFAESAEGTRLLRGCQTPDLKEVMQWIGSAEEVVPLEEAALAS